MPKFKKVRNRYLTTCSDAKGSASFSACGVIPLPIKSDPVGYFYGDQRPELLSDEVVDSFLPDEADAEYDPVTGNPIVRKAKLSLSDYELRYLDFVLDHINKEGDVDPDKIAHDWKKAHKDASLRWMSRGNQDGKLFMWTPQKIVASQLLGKGHRPVEVAKRIGRHEYEVKAWMRYDSFQVEIARRKLEQDQEDLEERKRELRELSSEIRIKARKYLALLDHPSYKVQKRAIQNIRVLLQEAREFVEQERKDRGEATEIIKSDVSMMAKAHFTIDAILQSFGTKEDKRQFIEEAAIISEEIAEKIALDSTKAAPLQLAAPSQSS